MKTILSMLLGGVITLSILAIGREYVSTLPFLAQYFSSPSGDAQTEGSNQPEVLYWVAPMDANFRRDQPGQSPMGMDLVPV
jgi:Cu(I)/Ag(I) efflux system membrane fusion protein